MKRITGNHETVSVAGESVKASEENATVHVGRIKANLPPNGQVRILKFTDKQYARMECFLSKTSTRPESQPDQILLF